MIKLEKKERFRKRLLVIIFCGLIFTAAVALVNGIQYRKTCQNTNVKIAEIVKQIQEKYPNVDRGEIIDLINQEGSDSGDKNILNDYGINLEKDSVIVENESIFCRGFVLSVILCILFLFAFILILYQEEREKTKKVNEITGYLNEITTGNYRLDIDDNTEDELSLLKSDIYKITVLLREQAENSLADKMAVKDSISDISHQLKTPLTSIMIMTDLLAEDSGMDVEQRREFIDEIRVQTLRMNFQVQSLLKLTKFDANTIVFSRKAVSAEDIIMEAIRNVDAIVKEREIELDLSLNANKTIMCDSRWQTEAIMNILKNACENSPKGSRIVISSDSNPVYTEIVIRDYGKGMSQSDRQHIFDRFYKGENSSEESCGIGMSLAKTIIEKDGGTISLRSEKDRGTEFTIKYF